MISAVGSLVEFVRPGEGALEWLERTVADLKGGDALAGVLVVPPTLYAGQAALRRLAARGGYVNVRAVRLGELAGMLGEPNLAGRVPLSPMLELAAARRAAADEDRLRALAGHLALDEALVGLFRELRLRQIEPGDEGWQGSGETAMAAGRAYLAFRQTVNRYVDATALCEAAASRLNVLPEAPPELAQVAGVVVFLPPRLDPAGARLLAAVSRWTTLRVALCRLDDPQGLADRQPRRDAEVLARALEDGTALGHPEQPTSPRHALGNESPLLCHPERRAKDPLGAWAGDPSLDAQDDRRRSPNDEASGQPANGAPAIRLPRDTVIVQAPDQAEEVREVVRQVVARMQQGHALHRMAILYQQPEPYASLLRDALELAQLPWCSLSGLTTLDRAAGRTFVNLLQLPSRHFGRQAVLEVVGASPAFTKQAGMPSIATWERLSRQARVLRGVNEWTERLRHVDTGIGSQQSGVGNQAMSEAHHADGSVVDSDSHPLTPDSRVGPDAQLRAQRLADAVEEMAAELTPPTDGSSWAVFVAWAEGVRARLLGEPQLWPAKERPFAEGVRRALGTLAEGDQVEEGTTFEIFRSTLERTLAKETRPAGRLGHGIVVGPVQAASGMAFDYVAMVGLNEGAFPPPPPVDPFFPVDQHDPLGTRETARGRDRRAFLAALASASLGLILSLPSAALGRAAFPSRWLLETAATLLGREHLSGSEFHALDPSKHPWLRLVQSAQQGVATGPAEADAEDFRLKDAIAWTRQGKPLRGHPLAQRPELMLGRALDMRAMRRSAAFTSFDGNVGSAKEAASIARLFDDTRPSSASAVQTWARCPFSYFLGQVLRVPETETPEDRWTINAAERGSLIHEVLEGFLGELAARGTPAGTRRYTAGDGRLLRDIATERLAAVEESGRSGHPLVWKTTRADILADLETFLREDERWRESGGWEPGRFEQGFGFPEDETSWPALDIAAGGDVLRFRGKIDRIDLNRDAERAYVFDYKTGKPDDYQGLPLDAALAGKNLQLALYSEAAARNLPGTAVTGAYWFVSSRGRFGKTALPGEPSAVSARLREVLGLIARGIRSGSFPQTPGAEDEFYHTFQSCGYCPYDRVCPADRDSQWLRKMPARECQPYVQLSPTIDRP